MDSIDRFIFSMADQKAVPYPILICLYTSNTRLPYAEPMLRVPEPPIGMPFDEQFLDHLKKAYSLNSAIHDGAIMVRRDSYESRYYIDGWSHRLYPPPANTSALPNRGSAFNSCLLMSTFSTVDRIYIVSRNDVYSFNEGSSSKLQIIGHV